MESGCGAETDAGIAGMEDSHTVHLLMPPPEAEVSSAPKDDDSALSTLSSDIPVQPAGSTVSNDSPEQTGNALFGVFDGHGGSAVAKFTGSTLHTRLQSLDSYSAFFHKATNKTEPKNLGTDIIIVEKAEYEVALKESFLKTDEDLRAGESRIQAQPASRAQADVRPDPNFFNDPSGCTAVVGLVSTDGRLIVVCLLLPGMMAGGKADAVGQLW